MDYTYLIQTLHNNNIVLGYCILRSSMTMKKKRQRSSTSSPDHLSIGQSNDKNNDATLGTPTVGMKVEICDPDNIWSSAKIVKVTKNKDTKSYRVLVRYDGWGDEWDELVTFREESNDQTLVPVGTYTKKMKCFVDLLPKKGKNSCTLWPCIINIRCPNPMVSVDEYKDAEQFLRDEPKVLIQPYGLQECYVPESKVSDFAYDGGQWINTSRIRMWKSDIEDVGYNVTEEFKLAFDIAVKDMTVPDILPIGAFDKGSLVKAKYRVKPDWYVDVNNETNGRKEMEKSERNKNQDETLSVSMKLPTSQIITDTSIDDKLIYHAPPILPTALQVNTSIYAGSQIKKSETSGKWIASYNKNGNDIFLGTFTTQFEAHEAIQAAISTNTVKEKQDLKPMVFNESISNKIQDMKNLSLSTVVSLRLQQNDGMPQNTFSFHEWTVQHAQHKGYQLEKIRLTFEELKREREIRSLKERQKKLASSRKGRK